MGEEAQAQQKVKDNFFTMFDPEKAQEVNGPENKKSVEEIMALLKKGNIAAEPYHCRILLVLSANSDIPRRLLLKGLKDLNPEGEIYKSPALSAAFMIGFAAGETSAEVGGIPEILAKALGI